MQRFIRSTFQLCRDILPTPSMMTQHFWQASQKYWHSPLNCVSTLENKPDITFQNCARVWEDSATNLIYVCDLGPGSGSLVVRPFVGSPNILKIKWIWSVVSCRSLFRSLPNHWNQSFFGPSQDFQIHQTNYGDNPVQELRWETLSIWLIWAIFRLQW